METRGITLDQLYNYLEGKFAHIDQRLDNIEYHLKMHDRQFAQLEKRMDSLEHRMESLEHRMENLENKVQSVYDTRDKIKLDFNRRILLGNSLLAGVVAFIVAMFTGKYELN